MFQNPPKALIRELRNIIGDDSISIQVQKIIGEYGLIRKTLNSYYFCIWEAPYIKLLKNCPDRW